MSDWQLAFGEIDDDYLTGISNKGIVKRAYKDLETIPCMAAGQNLQEAAAKQLQDMAFAAQEVLELTVGEETVQIRLPLGESTCSCPSRSICRHVVQGILAMKAAFAASEAVEIRPRLPQTKLWRRRKKLPQVKRCKAVLPLQVKLWNISQPP